MFLYPTPHFLQHHSPSQRCGATSPGWELMLADPAQAHTPRPAVDRLGEPPPLTVTAGWQSQRHRQGGAGWGMACQAPSLHPSANPKGLLMAGSSVLLKDFPLGSNPYHPSLTASRQNLKVTLMEYKSVPWTLKP